MFLHVCYYTLYKLDRIIQIISNILFFQLSKVVGSGPTFLPTPDKKKTEKMIPHWPILKKWEKKVARWRG